MLYGVIDFIVMNNSSRWCYQRPFTTLELQVRGGDLEEVVEPLAWPLSDSVGEEHLGTKMGLLSVTVEVPLESSSPITQKLHKILKKEGKTNSGDMVVARDPAGVQVKIVCR